MELYVHIPFCVKKCDYCDFLSFPQGRTQQHAYVEALIKELKGLSSNCEGETVTSIFLGGGTPSALEAGEIGRIMETIQKGYPLSDDCEVTMEANPGTLSREKAEEYQGSGINRISLGCQSTIEQELKNLGRIHTYGEFLENYEMLRECGFTNLNVDLMSGIPNQKAADWEHNLRTIAQLSPEHISAYSLIVEEGTPFASRKLNLPSEEEERKMYEQTAEILGEYGYHQYEISNYAKPGRQCRHNEGYWRRVNYLGAGLGASSLWKNIRYHNTSDWDFYLKNAQDPGKLQEDREILTREDQMEEFLFLGLRMMDGISLQEFRQNFQVEIEEIYGPQLKKLTDLALIQMDQGRLSLTRKGISLSNQVFVEFMF